MMKIPADDSDCQLASLARLAEGPQGRFRRPLKLAVRRRLGPTRSRTVERRLGELKNRVAVATGGQPRPAVVPPNSEAHLEADDWVRVRSREEIEAMLDHSRKLRGCSFAADMDRFCDTRQQVLTPVRRFVDERDLSIVNTSGLVLLKDAICAGTPAYGHCDRSCFFFWREEWLEKVEGE